MSTSATVDRKYALTRIDTGDYVLPSNDGQTIWRIARYTDGPSFGLDDWPRDRDLWAIWRWVGTGRYVDFESWEHWDRCDDGYEKRGEAIDAALRKGRTR